MVSADMMFPAVPVVISTAFHYLRLSLIETLTLFSPVRHCQCFMYLSSTVLPSIVDLPSPRTHTKGDHFELVCSFTGIPAPEIHWEKNGSVLLLREGMRVINTSGRSQLEINNLALSDAGVYSCSVTNVAGNVTKSVRLEVEGELTASNL